MKRKVIYSIVVAVGLIQTAGFLLQNKTLRGLGIACCSSPLPIVFTEVRGVETFASDFFIQYIDSTQQKQEIQITPALYSKLQGPYNRRNIYGAAIAYGPVLKEEQWSSILSRGLCDQSLIKEMGLATNGSDYAVRIKTKTQGRTNEWILKPQCK